jgi:hypothetical protein
LSVTDHALTVSELPGPAEVIARAVSRHRHHHDGYRLTGGYITTPFVVTAERPTAPGLAKTLSAILGSDLAEALAGIGPVNAWTVSSFCGPDEGLIAGVDLLTPRRPDDLYLFSVPGHDGGMIPVHAMQPPLDASAALPGGWPIRGGAFVPFAMKHVQADGPAVLTAALAIGIPADPSQARLFMEDPDAMPPAACHEHLADVAAGQFPGTGGPGAGWPQRPADPDALPDWISPACRNSRLWAAARSVAEIGAQRGRQFARILVGADFTLVPEGHVGCAMSAVACLQIARSAVPEGPDGPGSRPAAGHAAGPLARRMQPLTARPALARPRRRQPARAAAPGEGTGPPSAVLAPAVGEAQAAGR